MSDTGEQEQATWSFVTGLMVGAAFGATAALLCAPKRGRELRSDIVSAATDFGQTVSTQMNSMGKAAGEIIDRGRTIVTEANRAVRKGAETAADASVAVYDSGRASVARVASAVESGKEAASRKEMASRNEVATRS